MRQKCKICDSEFNSLQAHIIAKHHMSMEEYNAYEEPISVKEEVSAIVETETIPEIVTPDELTKARFGGSLPESYASKPLQEFLDLHKLTEFELNQLVDRYKTGAPISATQSIKNNTDIGNEEAEKVKDQQDVTTRNLYVAEALVKSYGFACIAIKKGPPKVWILKRK